MRSFWRIAALGMGMMATVALAGGPSAGAAGAATEPPIVSSDYFAITSWDHAWDGAVTDASGRLWAAKCKRGEQEVSFSKTITIPGNPTSVYVDLASNGYVKKLVLKLDNQNLVKGKGPTKSFKGDLGAVDRGRFTDGEHVLKIVAEKKKTPKGITPLCGIRFYIKGTYQADLQVEDKAPALFWPSPYSRSSGTFTVTNNGPSASPGGTFTVSHSDASETLLLSVSAPFSEASCKTTKVGINCTYGTHTVPNNGVYFPVGASATFTVGWEWYTINDQQEHIPSPRTDGSYSSWSLFGAGTDPLPGNNSDSIQIYVCGGVESPPDECEGAEVEDDGDGDGDSDY